MESIAKPIFVVDLVFYNFLNRFLLFFDALGTAFLIFAALGTGLKIDGFWVV